MTHRERELLDFIRRYQAVNRGVSPSFAEMQDGIGLCSKSGVARLLNGLSRQGLVRRELNKSRAITLIHGSLAHITDDALAAEFRRRFPAQCAAAVQIPLHGRIN